MKILVIGGSGFIGPFIVNQLAKEGHELTVFHRGSAKPNIASSVKQIFGNRNELEAYRREFVSAAFDAVIDVILSSETQAKALVDVFRGIAGRLVIISSQDVYRAYGVLLGHDKGPPQSLPVTEDSELRTHPPYSPEHARQMQGVFEWLDEEYDKVGVERAVMADRTLPATILRLPMVYGPGDPLHRFYPILKRVDDGRKVILMDQKLADWRGPRGYVENVAQAVALAAVSPKSAGRIYNVVDPEPFTEREWTEKIARAAGWSGKIQLLPSEKTPQHIRSPIRTEQELIVSSARIREELSYRELVPPDLALKRTIKWERINPPASVPAAQFDYAAEDAALGMS